MARAEDTELIDKFEEFYRNYYRNEIGELAQQYPTEEKSLYVDWGDLYRFDPDLADDVRTKPQQLLEYAEEALRLYDLPVDVSLGQAHVRIENLPDATDIREIRADHRDSLIAVQGIVRKATDVRPKITDAAFECQRCGTLTRIPQIDGDFQEPHECQGCERQGPFRINFDQSEFVDAQKIRVQESPEGLRGGETPQSIDVSIEDDITGEVTAGDHVEVTGTLKLDQQGSERDQSPMFDVYMDGLTVTIEDEQFEEMDITDADKKEIVELSNEPNIYEQMVGAIAPSIYGYEMEKRAMIFQLFSGVTKHLPDDSRIRGDLHVLLIGDPGTGKCQKFDSMVTLDDGREVQIGELVESHLHDPIPVDDGVYQPVDFEVQSIDSDGSICSKQATKVWKREAPEEMYRIRTASGSELEVTPSHPLFVQSDGEWTPVRADELSEGEFVATPGRLLSAEHTSLDVDFRRVSVSNANSLSLPEQWTPELARLLGYIIAEGHVTNQDNTKAATVTNADEEVIEDVIDCLESVDLRYTRRQHHSNEDVEIVVCSSTELVEFLQSLEPAIIEGSAQQQVPAQILSADTRTKSAFLRAYIEGESHISAKEREITVTSMSRELLEGIRSLLLSLRIDSTIERRRNDSYRLRISGGDFVRYVESVGLVTERKSRRAAAFEDVPQNTNTDVIPDLDRVLRRIREKLALSQFDLGIPRTTYQHYERGDRNPSRKRLSTVVDSFQDRLGYLTELRTRLEGGDWETIEVARDELGVSQAQLADEMDVDQTAVSYYERKDVVPDGGRINSAKALLLDRIDDALSVREAVAALEELVDADISWESIQSIETVEPEYDWVYDLEVRGTHNYISNGVVSHNSAMLQYIKNIAPRSVYTSGKGSSAAGLCVTGDTMIHTDTGFRPVQDIVREEIPEPVTAETAAEKGVSIRTFDRDTGEMTDATSSHVWRMPEKPCRRIETSHGKELEASVNTPVLTGGEARMEWTPIAEIESGDQVAVPQYEGDDRSSASVSEDTDPAGKEQALQTRAASTELRWDEVVAAVDTGEKEVYDLTVPETNNFVGNGIVTHNTAAAVRDDFGDGQQWTLEAGALVLADQGIAAVDELDKMRCVTGDTLVHTPDGTVPIRELAFGAGPDCDVERHENGRTLRNVDATVWTMTEDGRLTTRDVTAIHEYDAPSALREVTLESGESVTATADHPFFVLEEGTRQTKPADDLSEGDLVYVPDSIPPRASDGGTVGTDLGVTGRHGPVGDGVELRRVAAVESTGVDETHTAESPAAELDDRREPKVYDLTVEGTHNFLANGMVVHNSEDQSAMHQALEQQSYHPDSEVLLADGRRVGIGEFVDGKMEANPGRVVEGVDCELLPVGDAGVHTVDLEANEVRKTEIDRVSRHEAPEEFVRVAFSNGREIVVTPDHPMFVDDCDGVGTIEARDIEEGAFVPAPRKLPNSSRPVELDSEPQVGKEKDVDRPESLSPALGEILGFLVAEGHAYAGSSHEIGFSNQDERLFDRMEQLMRSVFGMESSDHTNAAGTVTKCWISTKLYRWFETNFPEVMRTAREKRIPAAVLGASEEVIRRFLVGAFAGDGGVESEAMSFATASQGLARDYADALSKIGVATRIHHDAAEDSWKTYVMGDSTARFVEQVVRPEDPRYADAREFAKRSVETPRHHDALEERSSLRYYRVTDVETVPNGGEYECEWVYDVTVEPTNTFVSQGVVLHNSISVSKAGINATLKSRCSLLGAANPIYGRFDEFEPIGEQIDLEPPLISRFDLIFTVTDQPDEEEDTELAEHILKTNYAGELNTHRTEVSTSNYTEEEVATVTDEVAPTIEPELLRKYVAYAKRNCFPTMTEEAKSEIQDFYVELRGKGAGEDAAVPVTARKLESLVRLSEASARVRLSDTVEREDATRAIEIARYCLEDVGMDPETGEYDADMIETGTSKSQRDRIKDLLSLVEDIEAEYDEGAPVDVIVERAEEAGMKPSKAEHEIEQLKQKGEVYEPRTDHLRTT
ncbi:MAG: LAGLIDADG family homing endonuclease [Haloarculaceae archaeon]